MKISLAAGFGEALLCKISCGTFGLKVRVNSKRRQNDSLHLGLTDLDATVLMNNHVQNHAL